MPRIRNADRTRALLTDAAARLFATQGYEQTPIEKVIQEAGVSKGAFYHHFSSKEEMLDAVTEAMVAKSMELILSAAGGRASDALTRLNRFLTASRPLGRANLALVKELAAVLYRDENATMRRKMEIRATIWVLPLLADIIRHGTEENIFHVPDAEETARLILQLSYAFKEAQVAAFLEACDSPAAVAVFDRRLDVYFEMLERMLGAPRGSIERYGFGELTEQAPPEIARETDPAEEAVAP